MLWSLHELQKALNLPISDEDITITGISIDTRTLQKGDLFVALTDTRDGHDFVKIAKEKGAVACLVSKKINTNIPYLLVKNTLEALTILAKTRVSQHSENGGKRIAITGSSGKTSLTNMLSTVCDAHHPEKSYNNHWGVPLTLARMPKNSKIAVIEIGTNHIGEIEPLVKLSKPHVCVITNIAHAHIGNFPSLNELSNEKLSIQNGLSSGGILVLLEEIAIKYKDKITTETLTFGFSNKADIYLIEKIHNEENNLKIATPAGEAILKLNMHGDHHILNALATVGAIYALKLPIEFLQNLHKVSQLEGRGKIHKIKDITIIDDSFNANPLSMKMSLKNLQNHETKGRKIAIIGDMLELGSESLKYHKNLIEHLNGIDKVITVGENMKFLYENLPENIRLRHYNSVKDINIEEINSLLNANDTVLVKGSKGIFWVENFVQKLLIYIKN